MTGSLFTVETQPPAILDKPSQPWIDSPYSLISWSDMEQFSARAFYLLGYSIGAIPMEVAGSVEESQFPVMQLDLPSSDPLKDKIAKHVATAETWCDSIDLSFSCAHVKRFQERLKGEITPNEILRYASELRQRIADEMKGKLFFHVPADRVEFYSQRELFGADVNAKFPSIVFDMVEAGNCYAMGRGTACVFHLMRIMEVGVQEFGANLGVTLVQEKNWQNILDEINKAIKALPPKDPATVEMSQASANLYSVKLAWRNEVMHPKDTYTLEEAENLIGQVKIFMAQLASII